MRKNELLGELAQCQWRGVWASDGKGAAGEPGGSEDLPGVCDAGKGIVPGQESSQHAEDAAGLLQAQGNSGGAIVLCELGAEEEEEGKVQGEEEAEEHDGGAQGAQQQDGGKDEPAGQEEANSAGLGAGLLVGVGDLEGGREDEGVRDPEATVGREGGGTKGVSYGHLPGGKGRHNKGQRRGRGGGGAGGGGSATGNSPHAGEELDEPAVAEGQGDDDVGLGDTTGLEVDGGQDKGGQGEGAEAEGGRVGDLAVLDGLVQAGLELTAKGREASIVAAVGVGEGVPVVVVALGRLGIVVGPVGVSARGMGDVLFDVCVRHLDRASWLLPRLLLTFVWLVGAARETRTVCDRERRGWLTGEMTMAGCWGRRRERVSRKVPAWGDGKTGRRGEQALI